ncbi:MAG: anti-sigma-factor antagonist [Verrucomicrobiaceae bacterium]|nr:anti-sigma-factor antagonist [Verrucomicrobiaceae bacterium]MDB6116742.1 anti-sigma-factor antagonist [Verrucomicrobiaceae bacterium]
MIDSLFWLRIEGKGCFQNSVDVKRVVRSMMEKGTRNFVVDLDRCPTMDSTFLGTLTGIALRLRESGGGRLTVLNANARNQQLLTSLGLDHVLEVDTEGTAWSEERLIAAAELGQCESCERAPTKSDQAEHVLEAHKALTQANEENASRFQDVIVFLEKELHRNKEEAAAPAVIPVLQKI